MKANIWSLFVHFGKKLTTGLLHVCKRTKKMSWICWDLLSALSLCSVCGPRKMLADLFWVGTCYEANCTYDWGLWVLVANWRRRKLLFIIQLYIYILYWHKSHLVKMFPRISQKNCNKKQSLPCCALVTKWLNPILWI